MKKRRIACALALVASLPMETRAFDGGSVNAEVTSLAEAPAVRTGDRVRLRLTNGSQIVGRIGSLSATSIRVSQGRGSRHTEHNLDWSRVQALDRSIRRASRWKRGAVIGALGNVLVWSTLGLLFPPPQEDALSAPAFGLLTAPVGALVGGLIGHVVKKDVWEPVPFDRDKHVSVGFTFGGSPRRGVGAALTLSWD